MSRRFLVALVGTIVAISACGGGDEIEAAAEDGTTTTVGTTATSAADPPTTTGPPATTTATTGATTAVTSTTEEPSTTASTGPPAPVTTAAPPSTGRRQVASGRDWALSLTGAEPDLCAQVTIVEQGEHEHCLAGPGAGLLGEVLGVNDVWGHVYVFAQVDPAITRVDVVTTGIDPILEPPTEPQEPHPYTTPAPTHPDPEGPSVWLAVQARSSHGETFDLHLYAGDERRGVARGVSAGRSQPPVEPTP